MRAWIAADAGADRQRQDRAINAPAFISTAPAQKPDGGLKS